MTNETDVRIAASLEGKSAARRTWDQFERVGDRLDEVRHIDDIDEETAEQLTDAFREVEDLVMDLDDALDDARLAFEEVLQDDE